MAIKYIGLREQKSFMEDKDKEKIEAIRKELRRYKGEFVDKLQRILKTQSRPQQSL